MNKLIKELIQIQGELKAPKNQYNNFGKYKYRNQEDILEAVKPLLKKHNSMLTIEDEIVEVGGRVYVKAIVEFINSEDVSKTVTAFAREAENRKGMDDSQITGTASSYARKYALNGLFLIDDTKDVDTNESKSESDKNFDKLQATFNKNKKIIFNEVESCKDKKELEFLWKKKYSNYQEIKAFKDAIINKGNKF